MRNSKLPNRRFIVLSIFFAATGLGRALAGAADLPEIACPSFTCGACAPAAGARQRANASAAFAAALGEKRILVLRVDFSDAVGAAISSNAAVDLVNGLNAYYRDMSYGLMTFAPVGSGSAVTDALRLPEPSTAYNNDFAKLLEEARVVAAQAGYPAANYDYDIVCTGTRPTLVFGAIAFVGGPGLWLANGNFSVGVAGHELGHNLGLPHASFWNTGEQSTIGPGTIVEYGDPFDSMGVPGGNTSHFNARFKHLLGWIPDADAPVVSSNGIYRLFAHDHPQAGGVRALRAARSPSQNYWIEFRQAFNSLTVSNGVTLRWASNGWENTLLLDTTPGTPPGRADGAVLIGRTFSDPCIELHLTPLGKGNTVPESLDVMVQRGPFPGNRAPTVTVSATNTAPLAGEAVTLEAAAMDPDGDALAYFWDLGNDRFGANQPSFTYAWPANGEYVVRCTVTDMKGRTASDSIVVRVGSVSTFNLAGRILDHGSPVEGVLVRAGIRFSYTDSDGSYTISRLPAGSYTVAPNRYGYNFFPAGFTNPVALGPNAQNLDFVALSTELNYLTLVATGSVWRFFDAGASPGTDWMAATFDDSAWNSGPAKLGYGVGDERTLVSFGGSTTNRHTTTYFRRTFAVADAGAIDFLIFRLRRDDGAVVYLNGVEVYRENMPAGQIQYDTFASADVGTTDELTFFKRLVMPAALQNGTNLLAVEVHQRSLISPDLSFDLELVAGADDPQSLVPRLNVAADGGEVFVSWPAGFTQWEPVAAAAPGPPGAWTRVNDSVVTTNGWNLLRVPADGSAGFYQLQKAGLCR